MPIANAPQSNRQHAVPQNIMDVEFKLVGDLTMRQFSYLMLLGLSAYFSFLLVPGIFKWPSVIFLVFLALGLAFVPVQERGLDEWLANFFRSINSPTQRIWRKEPQLPTAFMYDSLAVVKQEMITLAPTSSRRKLEEYLKRGTSLDTEDPLDIPVKSYMMKVREAYPDVPKTPGVGLALEEPQFEELPQEEEVSSQTPEIEDIGEEPVDSREVESPKVSKPDIPLPPSGSLEENKAETPASVIKTRSVYTKSYYGDKGRKSASSGPSLSGRGINYGSFGMISSDAHTGRKFVNLIPSDGEIILPIRGQRVLDTSESLQIKTDLDEKARKLKELLEKIRVEEGIPNKIVQKTSDHKSDLAVVDEEAQDVVEKLRTQNDDLSSEIERLRGQISRSKSMSLETGVQEQLLKKLESQKSEIASSYAELRSQVQDLQKKLHEKSNVSTGEGFIEKVRSQIPVLTTAPNVLSGIVRDSDGKFLSDYLLIVKNSRGDTVRAFKTNSMGQFIVSTPLQNGVYTVEVSPANKTNLTFGIIPVEVSSNVIPTLDIVGK